jgi:translation initiation factor 2A
MVLARPAHAHVQECEELYQASWRPTLLDAVPPVPICDSTGAGPICKCSSCSSYCKAISSRDPQGHIAHPEHVDKVHLLRTSVKRMAVHQWVPPVVAAQRLPHVRVALLRPPSNIPGRRHVPGAPTSSPNPDSAKPRKRKGPKRRVRTAGGGKAGMHLGLLLRHPFLRSIDGEVPNRWFCVTDNGC